MNLSIAIADPRWRGLGDIEKMCNTACRAAVATDEARGISLLLTDDAEICRLNENWRGKNTATNVLSFPVSRMMTLPPGETAQLGDIVMAYETVMREARDAGTPAEHHACHLLVHGVLHLLGYDHVTDDEAREMEDKERGILARLGIQDPYQS
jgi:probable rRNA maturation factor